MQEYTSSHLVWQPTLQLHGYCAVSVASPATVHVSFELSPPRKTGLTAPRLPNAWGWNLGIYIYSRQWAWLSEVANKNIVVFQNGYRIEDTPSYNHISTLSRLLCSSPPWCPHSIFVMYLNRNKSVFPQLHCEHLEDRTCGSSTLRRELNVMVKERNLWSKIAQFGLLNSVIWHLES